MGLHRIGHYWSDVAAAPQVNPVCSQDWDPLSPEVVHSLLGGLGGWGQRWMVCGMAVIVPLAGSGTPSLFNFFIADWRTSFWSDGEAGTTSFTIQTCGSVQAWPGGLSSYWGTSGNSSRLAVPSRPWLFSLHPWSASWEQGQWAMPCCNPTDVPSLTCVHYEWMKQWVEGWISGGLYIYSILGFSHVSGTWHPNHPKR